MNGWTDGLAGQVDRGHRWIGRQKGQRGQMDRWIDVNGWTDRTDGQRWTDVNGWTDRRDGQMGQIGRCEQMDRQKRRTDKKSTKD